MGLTSEDLKRCYTLSKEAHEVKRAKEWLVSLAEKTTQTLSKEPATKGDVSDKVGDNAAKIADLEAMYDEKHSRLLNHVWWVEQAIEELVTIDDYKRVIRMRYVEGMLWRDIAEEMPCGERTVYRYHDHALELLGIDPKEMKNITISEG